jgi:predicted XRE-type DNA-binding protein
MRRTLIMKISRAERIKRIIQEIELGKLYFKHGNLYRSDTGKIASHDNRGYNSLTRRINGKQVWVMEHHVIYCLFNGLEDIPEGFEINHLDYDRKNNLPSNLELTTKAENMAYSKERVSKAVSIANKRNVHNAKLTEEEVSGIKKLLNQKVLKQYEIAEKYGVSPQQVSRINTGEDWGWVN